MSYSLSFSLALGAANAGKTLKAQLFDTSGANVGSAVTTGFVEKGSNGTYLWTGSLPDDFQGGVAFADNGSSAVYAVVAVNPGEGEYVDEKVSSRLAADTELAELSSGAPAATPTVEEALMLLYMALRNRMDTSGSTLKFYNDAGSVIAQSALSEASGTFTRGEMGAPV